jgi:hypothetical protein
VRIDTNMRLHAKVPLVAFLALMHVRIAVAGLVFGGWRGGDQGGIDDGAFA